jgi:hypothetical protein
MRVYEPDAAFPHELAQAEAGPSIERASHRDREGRQPGRLGLRNERGSRLADNHDAPAVSGQPARLGDNSELLPTEAP